MVSINSASLGYRKLNPRRIDKLWLGVVRAISSISTPRAEMTRPRCMMDYVQICQV